MTSAGPPTSPSSLTTAADRLTGESLPLIDLRVLSHSELLSLSLSTHRNRPIAGCDDDDHLVNPKIDRSVFNESAGSRRQTFSRLRLVPRQAAGTVPAPPPPPQQVPMEEEEDPRFVSLLRQLFRGEGSSRLEGLEGKIEEEEPKLVGVPIDYVAACMRTGNNRSMAVEVVEGKRKRGRPKKNTGNVNGYSNLAAAALERTRTASFEHSEYRNSDS